MYKYKELIYLLIIYENYIMKVKKFTFNPFQENTYILYDKTHECIIIDPGCYEKNEREEIKKFISENNLEIKKIINTHCHIDHILGNQFIHEKWGANLYIHSLDMPLLENAKSTADLYGLKKYINSPNPIKFLKENQTIKFGVTELKILFTPGHAPGHICLYNKKNNILIAGDVIFQGSIGRTDLPGGNYNILINSIKTKILCLPDITQIYCGHGPSTNLKYEIEHNPFLQ